MASSENITEETTQTAPAVLETAPKTKKGSKSKTKKKSKTAKKKVEAASEMDGDPKPKKRAPKTMKDGLVIVESPAKAKTIKKYLGRKFEVKASVGHIKDLPKSKIGVDVDNGFSPTYEMIKGKEKKLDEIKEAAQYCKAVYLAADPDREGEAIAWHVAQEIPLPKERVHRVLIDEITKQSVLNAIENPKILNQDRFESQQARRILDRLVGYKISPLLWTKVRRGLSAGRVQSVAVRILVERENEIRAFKPQPYWMIEAQLGVERFEKHFMARLSKVEGKRVERTTINTEEWAKEIVEGSKNGKWAIQSVQKKERKRNPYPPFITSTMQQEASKKLYFTAKRTMRLAQQLYEGIEIGDEGPQGLITYMRTDSTRLSDQAIKEARDLILEKYGKDYLPDSPNVYKSKKKAQDAHEAVRPTSAKFSPEKVKEYLDKDQFKLYDLIWKRYLASQMSQAVFDQTAVDLEVQSPEAKKFNYRATGSILRFPGFLTLWQTEEDAEEAKDKQLPDLTKEDTPVLQKMLSEKKMTQPPPRYSESSLIKELEELGIGRPSTYATILSTIQDRKYVEKQENRFHPTELGELVNELLVENFKEVVDVKFTATMEDRLDQIEEGQVNWKNILKDFYGPFSEELKVAEEKMRNVKREETPTNLTCPKCSKPVILKWGRNGKFAACQGYPECRFTSEFEQEESGSIRLVEQPKTDEKCEKCGSAMVIKMGRFGRFMACSGYPNCKTTKAITTGIKCPDCGKGELAEKRTRFGKTFYSCVKYPTCKYAIWDKPLKTPCPQCKHPFLVEKYTKKEGASTRCPNKECGYIAKKETADEQTSSAGVGVQS